MVSKFSSLAVLVSLSFLIVLRSFWHLSVNDDQLNDQLNTIRSFSTGFVAVYMLFIICCHIPCEVSETLTASWLPKELTPIIPPWEAVLARDGIWLWLRGTLYRASAISAALFRMISYHTETEKRVVSMFSNEFRARESEIIGLHSWNRTQCVKMDQLSKKRYSESLTHTQTHTLGFDV